MKKLLSLCVVLLMSSSAFGAGRILWSDSFEYADQAAFEAVWTNTFVDYTFGDMPTLTTAVASDGSQSFYSSPKGLAGVPDALGSAKTNVKFSIQWFNDASVNMSSEASAIWLDQSDLAAEEAQINFRSFDGLLEVSEWDMYGTDIDYDTGLVFATGWNLLEAEIDADGYVDVWLNGDPAAATYGGPEFWNGPRSIFMGKWWSSASDRAAVFDDLVVSDSKFILVITETGDSTDVVEGGATDTYDITLPGRYDGEDVSIQVSPGPQLDVGAGANTPINLNFTRVSPSDPNWIMHTVTVTANNDTDPEGDHTGTIDHLSSSSDPNFDGWTAQITVNITDDDGSAVLSKTTASVSEDGAQDQYTIHLAGGAPSTDVVVAISTTDQAGTDKHYLTFNSGNYMTPQTVTIAAIDDEDDEGEHQTVFAHTVTGDPLYAGAPASDMTVTIADNDLPAPGLLAQWKLDGDLTDATGNGHDGSPNGDPNYIAGAPFGDDPGGQALNLDGTGQGSTVPDDAALKPKFGITLSAWIQPDTYLGSPWQNIIMKNDFNDGGYLLEFNKDKEDSDTDGIHLGLIIGGSRHIEVAEVDPNDLTDGSWHHVVGTYDGSAMKIYVDGVEKFTKPVSGTLSQAGSAPVQIGYYPGAGGEYFGGGIDDVRIYNYGLSAREIQALMSPRASNPDPVHGSAGVDVSKVLGWSAPAGISSPTYNVYADTNFAKVDLANPSGQVEYQSIGQSGASFDPSPDLGIQNDIFWRVDVTDPAGPTTYPGQIWHFDTKFPCNDAFPLPGDISSPSGKPDCRVDLYDFAVLAAGWLQCNRIPLSECQ